MRIDNIYTHRKPLVKRKEKANKVKEEKKDNSFSSILSKEMKENQSKSKRY